MARDEGVGEMKVRLCSKCLYRPEDIGQAYDANATEPYCADCPQKSQKAVVDAQGYVDPEYRKSCEIWHRAWRKRRAAEMSSWAARGIL
jgi:hypothetical protein